MRIKLMRDQSEAKASLVDEQGNKLDGFSAHHWTTDAKGTATVTLYGVELVKEEPQQSVVTCPICAVQFLMMVKDIGFKRQYAGKNVWWKCGACGKKSNAEDWFSTEHLN
jgi:DNA-directed RNA polymerase subunit RPC12/RpoP